MKRSSKTAGIIGISDLVFAGNQYLADYARQYNANVEVVPTVIDTTRYAPVENRPEKSPVCIGWSGSRTTLKYFTEIIPVLKKLKEDYGDKIKFKQIGDANFAAEGIDVESSAWSYEFEVKELSKIDIGLMPMPENDWTKGKCGFKAILYMALEIPPVVSPVGVNTEIVKEGINGYWAQSEEEWVEKISRLIDSHDERKKLGQAARQLIARLYSVSSQQQRIAKLLINLYN